MRGTWGARMMSGDGIVRADDELLAGFEAHATDVTATQRNIPAPHSISRRAACPLQKQLTRIGLCSRKERLRIVVSEFRRTGERQQCTRCPKTRCKTRASRSIIRKLSGNGD
jgi:hypothetical protein